MKRLTVFELVRLNAYWVGISFLWNSLHPIVLPAVMLNLVPETQKNTYLGLLTFAGLVIATLVQPLAGALSDKWVTRWGRRRPLIVLGTALDLLFLAVLALPQSLLLLVIGYIGLQFTSNLAHGPMQGLMPDRVPPEQLGAASGLKNLMDMGGLVVAVLLAGHLLDPQARYPVTIIAVVGLVLVTSALVTVLGTREETGGRAARTAENPFAGLTRIGLREHAEFWWLIGARFLFLLGIYGIQQFAQYYLRDVLAVPDPVRQTGDLLAAITLALIPFAVAGGWISDRIGAKRVLLAASLLSGVGCLLLLLARTPLMLMLYGSLLGAGIGLFLTGNWALANRLAPAAEAGLFLGLTNLATAGSGALGRLEGPFIDMLNNAYPGTWAGYTALFLFGAVCTLGSALLLPRIHSPAYQAPATP